MKTFSDIWKENFGPPVNIENIIRELGLNLNKKAVLDSEISGQIERSENTFTIFANKKDHYFRQRFTLAHELGHYIYHSDLIGEGVDDNRAFRSTPDGNFYNTKIGAYEETQANKFAAKVLMPESLVKSRWEDVRDIRKMALLFQVSPAAMQIRLEGLNVI